MSICIVSLPSLIVVWRTI